MERMMFERYQQNDRTDNAALWGYFLLATTFLFFVFSSYALFISKLMPATGNDLLDAIKFDYYYCFLVPATGLVTWLFIYLNWMMLKFFRHN